MKFHAFTILVISLCFSVSLFGQEEKKTEKEKTVIYNQFKNEIGIDFQGLFNRSYLGNSVIGTNFIYKRRIGEKKFVSVNEKKVLRFQIGGSGDIPISTDTLDNRKNGTPILNQFTLEDSYFSLRTTIGLEWQRQFKKFQLFYGFDSGVTYTKDTGISSASYSSGNLVSYREGINQNIGVPLNGFIGFKYFFNPRISISLESYMSTSINFAKITSTIHYTDPDQDARLLISGKRNDINFGFDYLRYLNLSYYF